MVILPDLPTSPPPPNPPAALKSGFKGGGGGFNGPDIFPPLRNRLLSPSSRMGVFNPRAALRDGLKRGGLAVLAMSIKQFSAHCP